MSEIVFEKNLVTRRVPGYLSRATGEWLEPQEWREVDPGFPVIARCGALSAAAHNEDGARAMIETMRRARSQRVSASSAEARTEQDLGDGHSPSSGVSS